MSYVKQVWEDAPSTNSPITASRLNHIEDGIAGNDTSIGDLSTLATTNKSSAVGAINENVSNLSKIGKVLWEGTFTSGTLAVPGISDYTMIGIQTSSLLMIGNQRYGGLSFTGYNSLSTAAYGYRYSYDANDETLTTTSTDKGATDGSNQIAISKIIGIF